MEGHDEVKEERTEVETKNKNKRGWKAVNRKREM